VFDTCILTSEADSIGVIPEPANKVFALGSRGRGLWLINLAKFFRKNHFDVVVSENDWRWLPGLLLLARLRGFKVVFEAHGVFSAEMEEMGTGRANSRYYRLMERFLLPRCDCIVALSKDIEDAYRVYARKIETIRVFVMTDPENTQRRRLPARNTKEIGIIGPFDASRNVSTLRFLRDNLNRFPPSVRFVVIGRCSDRVDEPRIRYTGFIRSIEEYHKAISELDAVLVVEGIATSGPLNKILEPMSMGVPVFTNPKGLVGLDYAEAGTNILVGEDRDLPGIVGEAVADEERLKRIGEAGRKMVEDHYSFQKESKRLVSIIANLVASS
jgi:glycosyltransferase involved in cell wall biosynthesis